MGSKSKRRAAIAANAKEQRLNAVELTKKRKAGQRKAVAQKRRRSRAPKITYEEVLSESEDVVQADDDIVAPPADQKADVVEEEAVIIQPKPERVTLSCRFIGKAISKAEATRRWPDRYIKPVAIPVSGAPQRRKSSAGDETVENESECTAHYLRAEVDRRKYELGDCVHVNSNGGTDYLGRIIELFQRKDKSCWVCVQWFFRAEDTALREEGHSHDRRRVFYSDTKDDNLLECIVEKRKVVRLPSKSRFDLTERVIPACDYFYDMGYSSAYSTFYELPEENLTDSSEELSTVQSNEGSSIRPSSKSKQSSKRKSLANDKSLISNSELSLLDLYSGCGAMSTGLCMGARLTGANLVTRWAVDLNEHACTSLRYNHPETMVRNEAAEDFLSLIKEWHKLCQKYSVAKTSDEFDSDESDEDEHLGDGEYEVQKLIGIRWVGSFNQSGSATEMKPTGLEFKVRWKGFGEEEDSWEPASGLVNSPECVKNFVIEGQKKKILPIPGECDVICGGPPCQGASGFNRFRNRLEPLKCARNKQIIVYMDIVEFLRPRFVLMENVVDILKFADGILGRYALGRLVKMSYQAKLGLLVAGCYGLPQFRMRVFLWGGATKERLPPFPLPTHNVVMRGSTPQNWEKNVVAYDESEQIHVEDALVLIDAISDLPPIQNSETRDEMEYELDPMSPFQAFIRLPRHVFERKGGKPSGKKVKQLLYDHRPLSLNRDDYERTVQIPKKKGANFRHLKGIIILPDGTVDVERKNRVLLQSGKPLVPDYAISFVRGKSSKPFGRLWWDETVSTVVTRAEPHNQILLHPEQNRVLSIRENARLQGFPDFYKLFGSVKERYIQVGNAVAVPVARALGYALGQSLKSDVRRQISTPDAPLLQLPGNFPMSQLFPDLEAGR